MSERIITTQLTEQFWEHLRDNEKSRNTVDKYRRDLRCFIRFLQGRAVKKANVLDYKNALADNYALSSANSMIAAINSFLRFAGWADCCVKQFRVQRASYCSEKEELSKQEYVALVRTAERKKDERLSLLLQTICGTGIRVSEIIYITVESVRQGEAIVSCKGKVRKVFIAPELRKKLVRYAQKRSIISGALFVTKSGKPMDRSNIWRAMKNLCREAGVSPNKVYPHNLRHLFARVFYRLNKDIARLADILGHSNLNTTRLYIITTGEEHRRCIESMRLII